MIDREMVAKIARFAIEAYEEGCSMDFPTSKSDAVLAAVDEFTPAQPSHEDIEAEVDAINEMYLAQTARQAVVHWLREGWAKERIAWRKHLEANSR